MACTYIFRGHQFNSELELDDFLLSNGHLISVLGDAVFDHSVAMNATVAKLKELQKLWVDLDQQRRQASREYIDGQEKDNYKKPYMGVTDFLSGLKKSDGSLMFPQFRPDAYWAERRKQWNDSISNLNEDEEELIKVLYDGQIPQKITDEDAVKLRKLVENKWDQQGVIGSTIHKIFQLYFQNVNKNINPNLLRANIIRGLETFIQKEVNTKARQDAGKRTYTFEQIIPPDHMNVIDETIALAKQLHDNLTSLLGDDLQFFPEFKLKADLSQELDDPEKSGIKYITGSIDLLVVDKEGNSHVIDFKTSPKNYNSAVEYNSIKKLAFEHQLATYNRMLAWNGLNNRKNRLFVVPIQINNFKHEGNGYYSYTGISGNRSGILYDDLTSRINGANENSPSNNISVYINDPYVGVFSQDGVLKTVKEQFQNFFADYKQDEEVNRDEVQKELEELGCFNATEDGYYVYRIPKSPQMQPIKVKATDSEAKQTLLKKVMEFKQKLFNSTLDSTVQVREELKKCIQDPSRVPEFPMQKNYGVSKAWFEEHTRQYRNRYWRVLDGDEYKFLETFGIIALLNTQNGRIDLMKVSLGNLRWIHTFGKNRTILTGGFENDVQQKSKQGTLILDSARGNIELIETMLVLNQMDRLFNAGCTVGKIEVVNPLYGYGVTASNEELAYNFRELCKHSPLKENNFENGRIRFCDRYELVAQEFRRIITEGLRTDWQECSDFRKIYDGSSESRLTDFIDGTIEEKIKALDALRVDLENGPSNKRNLLKNADYSQSDLNDDYVSLYNNILITIAELKGISLRQQLRGNDRYFQSAKLLTKGLSGTYIDNPGNLVSETLNSVTKSVTEAYQNVRVEMQDPTYKFNQLVEKLKKEKSYGIVGKSFFENQTNLYNNMFDKSYKDDLVLKRIDDISLTAAEKEFMIYFLDVVNKNRFPKKTEQELNEMRDSGSYDYYKVPLKIGEKGSENVVRNAKIKSDGLMSVLKDAIQPWKISSIVDRLRKFKDSVLADPVDNQRMISDESLFEMTSMFDRGESAERPQVIESYTLDKLERNLETLGLQYVFSYSVKENMNAVFPLVKAAYIHLKIQGANLNIEKDNDKGFKSDEEYVEKYVKSSIKNQNVMSENSKIIAKILQPLKRAASFCTLALSPVQFTYQSLQGIWNDISLMIRQPDGTKAFTPGNMFNSFKEAYKDLFIRGGKPSICSRLNELYGLNDMDMNSLVDKLKSDQGGFLHLNNFLMKFATRPDFYNRLTIFGAQMREDGCWDAHQLVNGELVYDWTKDKRFDVFAKYCKDPSKLSGATLEKFNKQKGLYLTMAQQFVKENATVGKGKNRRKFEVNMNDPMPLPRAYTTLQSESMKEIADNIYGYYSHEKKSLIHATLIGSMWMQFRTYWSGKKNQYLGTGGVKLRGHWKLQEGLFYDENGNIVKEDTGVPVYVWEGDWQEGIIVTLSDILKHSSDTNLFKEFMGKWNNEDEKLRRIYRNNINQLWIDLAMMIFGGILITGLMADWYKEMEKDNKDGDLIDQLKLSAAKVTVQALRTSFTDFNFINTIGDPLASWTPFSLDWAQKTITRTGRVLAGNEDVWDGLLNTFSAGRQFKPMLSTIKPAAFKTESEGGTFVPRNQRKKENA